MEAANLLLNAASLGASAPGGAGSGKAAESGEGSDFQGLVAKLLGGCSTENNVGEAKAGQQSTEEKSDAETDDGQKLARDIAQAECLLGSIGVILGTPDKASAEVATTSSPAQLDGISVSNAATADQASSSVDNAGNLVQTEQVGPSAIENEVMDVVSEAQSMASTQGTASMTVVQESHEQPESTFPVESEKSNGSGEIAGLTKGSDSSEKAELSVEQVKSDAKTDFSDVKTAPASEKQTAKAASSAAGAVLSNEQETAKAVETASSAQAQSLISDARSEAGSLNSSQGVLGQAAQTSSYGAADQTTGTANNSQQIIIDQSTGVGSKDAIDLPPVEKTKDVQNIKDSKPEPNMGVISSQVTDVHGFNATESVQQSQGNLPPEPVVSAKVINQIVKAAKVNITEGRSDIVLRLDPPHLGTVNMNVSVADGTVTATIQTSTESARQVLQSDLATLKQSLSDAGINVDQINVSVGGNPDQSQQGWNFNSGSHDWTPGGKASSGTFYENVSQDSGTVLDTADAMRTSSRKLDFLA
ncbi:MAG: flagellar hook-length control protein FliK [Armatimonadota bacterium]